MINKNRKGRFTLGGMVFDRWAERIMALVIVVKADHNYMTDEIEYYAYSDLFEESEAGLKVPEYYFTCSESGVLSAVKK